MIADYGSLTPEEIRLLPVTTFSYPGREPEAPWRAEAQQRIDSFRTAGINVQVFNGAGSPLSGATVEVKMKKNAFKFGTAVTETYLSINAGDNEALRANKRRYMEELQKLGFSYVYPANSYKWGAWESQWNPEAATGWLRSRGFDVAAHTLIWQRGDNVSIAPPDVFAPSILNEPALLKRRVNDHIRQIMYHNRGSMESWDVVNEIINNNVITNRLGIRETANWFKTVRAYDPTAKIVMNEAATNPGPGQVSLQLINFTGSVVRIYLNDRVMQTGHHMFDFNSAGFNCGLYLCKLVVDNRIYIRRVIVRAD